MTIAELSDAALIASVLGEKRKAVDATAYAVLEKCGGMAGVARASVATLAESCGSDATRIAAAIELGRRAIEAQVAATPVKLTDREAVAAWARPRLATIDHEQLWALCLDGRQGLRAALKVAEGGIHGLHINVRDVMRAVVREASSAFVLVHNHPSGDPAPSDEDIAFTRAIIKAADTLGTPLLDHVIVARTRASSMRDLGLMGGTNR